MITSPQKQLTEFAHDREAVRTSEIVAAGLSNQAITRLVRQGKLEKVGRGLYRLQDGPVSEHHSLIHASTVVSKSVIVLLSALRFHEIGTQSPFQVWLQLPQNSPTPKIEQPPVRIIRTSVAALFEVGVASYQVGGEKLRITTPARTVADCFKHRNKVGLDVCVEALRETLRARKAKLAEIDEMARLLRVEKVMMPYLEAMI
jgi:predicted transcriptional regulator of viral defense system